MSLIRVVTGDEELARAVAKREANWVYLVGVLVFEQLASELAQPAVIWD